jgi:hypothetical protein
MKLPNDVERTEAEVKKTVASVYTYVVSLQNWFELNI